MSPRRSGAPQRGLAWGPPFPQPPWEKARLPGVGSQGGKVSTCSSLGQWPGLAWPGRLVFLTNGASQPHACPSRPACPVPGARVTPGEAQGQHTQQDAGHLASESTWPEPQEPLRRRGQAWMGCQPARPAAPPLGHCWGAGSPGGLWAAQLEPAGRKGGGCGVKKVHLGKEREEERESKRGVAPRLSGESPRDPRERIFPNAEVK
uniref:Uncharacterized protein n=1 Tax=Myotis myotis TaxID=51298 RepID=A0A7J7XH17_MYOMY|nr:hypothetical protein mMyoMyo1_011593 [Myotis myotis]